MCIKTINMYLSLTFFSIHISCCFCYVNYEMFKGFNIHAKTYAPDQTRHTTPRGAGRAASTRYLNPAKPPPSAHSHRLQNTNVSHHTLRTNHTTQQRGMDIVDLSLPANSTHPTTTRGPILPVTAPSLSCYEAEEPSNIGTYEVPSQRDLVQMIRKTLVRMFNSYREKALYFLRDIREATKATSHIEKQCYSHSNRLSYRSCVKQVSSKCEIITKILLMSLERQRLDVYGFIEGKICNVSAMNADPMQLIKILAMEEAALEFALPSFLRLLGQCSVYCDKTHPKAKQRRPLRHMTDQELVVRHFLSKKTYKRILKDTKISKK